MIDFQINNLLKERNNYKTPQEKTKFVKLVIPILIEINNDIIRSEYTKMVADAIGIEERALLSEIRKLKNNQTLSLSTDNEIKKIVTKKLTISQKAQNNLLSVFFVPDNHLTFAQINEMIDNSYITDETLINVKSTIDKLICTVNNVKELIEQLYTEYIEQPEIQTLLSDLISISETFTNLKPDDFICVIEENIARIKRCQWEEEKEKIRNLYKNADEDDTEALKLQMQLRDKINNKLKLEKMND